MRVGVWGVKIQIWCIYCVVKDALSRCIIEITAMLRTFLPCCHGIVSQIRYAIYLLSY